MPNSEPYVRVSVSVRPVGRTGVLSWRFTDSIKNSGEFGGEIMVENLSETESIDRLGENNK